MTTNPTPSVEDDPEESEVAAELDEESPAGRLSQEKLLDRLLYRGVLPRYAFPTDVATFYVFDRDRSRPFQTVFQYTPSQGLPIALSQYAPGKDVWIDGKLWRSGAIYSPGASDRYDAWEARRLYYECGFCHYARTLPREEGTRSETLDCPACGSASSLGPAAHWLRPPGFAHPVDLSEETSLDDMPAPSYATRPKLIAQTPLDESQWERVNDRIRTHHGRERLLVTNRGPRREGYAYCTKCGRIEPTALRQSTLAVAHPKPFPDERNPICESGGLARNVMLGTDFITDVLLISIHVEAPQVLFPGLLATDVALRTICEALAASASSALGLETGELQAEYRPALTAAGREGSEAEIFLYDTLPGGAGFAKHAGLLGIELFAGALQALEDCAEDCDGSCYRCLRSYRNKQEHALLDRHVGAILLKSLLTGMLETTTPERMSRSTDVLFADLERQGLEQVEFRRDEEVDIPGIGVIRAPILVVRAELPPLVIALHDPLTPNEPTESYLRDLREYSTAVPLVLIDELLVRKNLPSATTRVLETLR